MNAGTLRRALDLESGEIVAVVGGGGKTSLEGRLAFETIATRGRVILTSTTHFSVPDEPRLSLVTAPDLGVMRESLRLILRDSPGVVVASAPSGGGRYLGYAPEIIAEFHEIAGWSLLVVNADGAKMRALKAPAGHEPVIPPTADVVVAVAGMDVLGATIDEERVFRPELVAVAAGVSIGAEVTENVIAAVLGSTSGGRKSIPAGARYVAVLNKADTESDRNAARRIAGTLLANGVDRVVVTSLRDRHYEAFTN